MAIIVQLSMRAKYCPFVQQQGVSNVEVVKRGPLGDSGIGQSVQGTLKLPPLRTVRACVAQAIWGRMSVIHFS